ncbi:unnamed protein product [Caenorhabditis bovis]|uniref:Uncharacterized protein n=1 Tax=Caenorhabditis bovis TaxID=2654633 RepID=A0A8S1ENY0_9PELO|nr:unnamed protein product [Caenorhabditis bovis]
MSNEASVVEFKQLLLLFKSGQYQRVLNAEPRVVTPPPGLTLPDDLIAEDGLNSSNDVTKEAPVMRPRQPPIGTLTQLSFITNTAQATEPRVLASHKFLVGSTPELSPTPTARFLTSPSCGPSKKSPMTESQPMPVETVPGQSQGIAPKLSILTIPITAPEATLTTPHQILVGSSPNQSPKQARRFVITNISRTVNESPTMIEPLGFKNTSPRPTQRSEADFDTDCSTGTSPENSIFNFTDQHSNEEEPRIAAPTFSENETDYQPQSFPSIESEHSNSLRSFSPSELNTTQLEDLPGYSTSDSSIASSRFDKASFEDVRETVSEPALESSKTTSRPIQESRHLSPIGELVPESNPKAPPSSMESKHNPLFYISSSESERSTEEMSSEIGSNESSGSLSDEFPATPLPSPEPQFTVPRVSMLLLHSHDVR